MIDPKAHVEGCEIGDNPTIRQFASVTNCKIGSNVRIAPQATIHGCTIGDDCIINIGVAMGPGFLLGNRVHIGPNVTLCNDAWPMASKEGFDPSQFDGTRWAIIIEDDVWIGANAVILPGTTILAGSYVPAGSVAKGSPYTNNADFYEDGQRPRLRMKFARAFS